MLPITLLVILVALPGAAQEVPHPYPELYCTDAEGRRVELGGLTCIAAGCVPPYLARCEMSLNNVMWRKVQDGCPAASFDGGEPAVDPGAVHPEVGAAEARPS